MHLVVKKVQMYFLAECKYMNRHSNGRFCVNVLSEKAGVLHNLEHKRCFFQMYIWSAKIIYKKLLPKYMSIFSEKYRVKTAEITEGVLFDKEK